MRSEDEHRHAPERGPDVLRGQGRRLTKQRQAIWDALLAEPDKHLSAEEIVQLVHEQLPDVNPSTVYRTLDLLVAEGLLLRTDLGADRAYYETAHEHPHHHVICERCNAVVHIHGDALDDLPARIETASGYTLGTREISFYGLCSNCRAAAV